MFYSPVNVESCLALTTGLLTTNEELRGTAHPISLHIQSSGGELMPLLSVLDTIDGLDVPVYTHVDGYAASAATILSVYGKRRFMTKRSRMLLHEVRATAEGPLSSVETDVIAAKSIAYEMYNIYLERTKLEKEGLEKLLRADVWLTAPECLTLGIVDEIR